MAQGITRKNLQALSQAKISDATLLFENSRWANAFYLAGYSLELALKACAAWQFQAGTMPDKKFVNSLYTHRFDDLIGSAGLHAELRTKQDVDSIFSANWGIAAEWTPEARYDATDKSSAHFLLAALTDANHGVLPWIETYW